MDWTPGAHASTFGGNPVSCAAALATIKLLEGFADQERGDRWRSSDGGIEVISRTPTLLIGDVRGKGLMIGIELVRNRQTKERATTERDIIVDRMFAKGVLVLGAGRNAIRLSPPLVLTKD